MAFTFASTLERTGINVVNPQTWHHVAVELHPKHRLSLSIRSLAVDDDVGHHQLALHIHKTPPRLGLEPGDQCNGKPDTHIAVTHSHHQSIDIALGQQFQGLSANGQGHVAHRYGFFVGSLYRFELQRQTFGQVASTHAGGLQGLQQSQGHLEPVLEFLELFQIPAGQALGQTHQRILQVAIVVERLNQEAQGGTIGLAQTQ